MCVHHHRGDIIGRDRDTGEYRQGATTDRRATARPLAPVTDIGANTYRPLATAHTLAPVVPVCFNLFRVITYQPQRDTGDRGDRNSTHRLLPTGSLLYVCASSSGRHPRSLAPVTDIGGEYLPTIGDRSHPRSCCSCMLQSLSGNDTDTPKEYRRTGGQDTGEYRHRGDH